VRVPVEEQVGSPHFAVEQLCEGQVEASEGRGQSSSALQLDSASGQPGVEPCPGRASRDRSSRRTQRSGGTRRSCGSAPRLVDETLASTGERWGVVTRVARELGVREETLRKWVHHAEVDGGHCGGATTAEKERIAALERENREPRRANEILKAASTFFARELDLRLPK
jgi:transposase